MRTTVLGVDRHAAKWNFGRNLSRPACYVILLEVFLAQGSRVIV